MAVDGVRRRSGGGGGRTFTGGVGGLRWLKRLLDVLGGVLELLELLRIDRGRGVLGRFVCRERRHSLLTDLSPPPSPSPL